MNYKWSKVRVRGHEVRPGYDAIRKDNCATLAPVKLWGAFRPLLGLWSNDMIVITYGGKVGDDVVGRMMRNHPEIVVGAELPMQPTVRPTTHEPRTREGVYVFHDCDVAHKDVDEFVRLTAEAWQHFENVDRYRAIPQALFRGWIPGGDKERYPARDMLLCTWYDSLKSWEESRTPPDAARKLFQRRSLLVGRSHAYATRLITD